MTHKAPTGARTAASVECRNSTVITAEEQLEQLIESAKQRMCEAPERSEKLRHWREMVRLIDQRSPSRVRFMERMAGLDTQRSLKS